MEDSSQPETQFRLFTLEEANSLLPQVSELLVQIQRRASQVGELQADLQDFREKKLRGEHVAGEARIVTDTMRDADRLSGELRGLLSALREVGGELKDVRMGLVDFRAEREDRVVYLCWRQGEDRIEYWHELDTGFASRQPL